MFLLFFVFLCVSIICVFLEQLIYNKGIYLEVISMAEINKTQLLKDSNGNVIYPITKIQNIVISDNITADEILNNKLDKVSSSTNAMLITDENGTITFTNTLPNNLIPDTGVSVDSAKVLSINATNNWSKPNQTTINGNEIINEISNLKSSVDVALNSKVDKQKGKGLSTNDYTTNEKNKLANLPNKNDFARVATTGDYNDLLNKAPINNGKLTITTDGLVQSSVEFNANQSTNSSINIHIPSNLRELSNETETGSKLYATNNELITSVNSINTSITNINNNVSNLSNNKANKTDVDTALSKKVDLTTYTAYVNATASTLNSKANISDVNDALSKKVNVSTYNSDVSNVLALKSDVIFKRSYYITGGNGNVAGYWKLYSFTPGSWDNRRVVFTIKSRHSGAGMYTITAGRESSATGNSNCYCDILFTGSNGSFGSKIFAYLNNGLITFFWKYYDYDYLDIVMLGDSPINFDNIEWMTSIDSNIYGSKFTEARVIASSSTLDNITATNITTNNIYTKQIIHSGSKANLPILQVIDNTVDGNGVCVELGGNGSTVIGAGESVTALFTTLGSGVNDEHLYLAADNNTYLYSNCNVINSRKETIFNTSGDWIMPGKLLIKSSGSESINNYSEGIRILPATNGWSNIFFSNNTDTTGTHEKGWLIGKRGSNGDVSGRAGDFTIECNSSSGTGFTLYADGNRPRWNNNELAYTNDITNIRNSYLPLSGGTLTGNLGFKSNYLIKPVAEFRTSNERYTGAITITLPAGISNTMVSMWIDVYNYVANTSFSVHVGGYTYNNSTWYHQPFGMVYGANETIRLGHNGTNFVIYIGETHSTWTYPQISVRDVILGYSPAYDNWKKDWAISFSTSFSNVTATINHYAWTTKNFTPPASLPANGGRADYLTGFSGRNNVINWGTLQSSNGYGFITRMDTSNDGSVAFADKNGQTSMQIDGYYYQNEGNNRVLDTSNVSGTTNYIPKFTSTNTIGDGWQAKNIIGVSHCDWQSNEYSNGQLITLNTLAYWNGAHNGNNNSNLKYCTRGEIASISDITSIGDTNYVKKTGDTINGNITITGNIAYRGTNSTDTMIKFISNTVDQYGNGIAIGGGGPTIIGSGESAEIVMDNITVTGGQEVMAVCSDTSIDFYTNCQYSFSSANKITMNTDGSITTSGLTYGQRAGKGAGYAQFAQYDGSNNNPTNDWYSHLIMNHSNSTGYYTEIATCFHSDNVYFRRQAAGTTYDWRRFAFADEVYNKSNLKFEVSGSTLIITNT